MIKIKTPNKCSPNELNSFIQLVKKGGEVNLKTLSNLVKKAQFLAFSYNELNILIGVGAIKNPNISYRNKVFHKAGLNHLQDQYKIELGWFYVEKKFRRKYIGTKIINNLLDKIKNKKIYAITRTNNKATKHLLENFKFHKSNEQQKLKVITNPLILFIRN